MQSPLKKIIVYDLETGGFDVHINRITEIAMVVIDLEMLEIEEEFSVMVKPNMNLNHMDEEPYKEAKKIIKLLATKDEDTNSKILTYKETPQSLKNYTFLEEELTEFYKYVNKLPSKVFNWEQLEEQLSGEWGEMFELYFNLTYNPEALEVTKISKELMLSEGVDVEEAVAQCKEMIERYTIGNNKPILAGHNIKKFDNAHFEDFMGGAMSLSRITNSFQIDTLEWARLRFFELSNFSLGTCANAVGITLTGAHRALPDTIANAKLLIELLKGMRGEGSQESTYKRKKYTFNF